MREHQIIINLKPEHYQELERLSRASGARSVSVFVKERMLISLGIGGSSSSSNLSGSLNVAAVTSDIRRLHRDLQVFVAESLSGKDFGYVAGESTDLATPHEEMTPGAALAKAANELPNRQDSTSSAQVASTSAYDDPVSLDQLAPLANPPVRAPGDYQELANVKPNSNVNLVSGASSSEQSVSGPYGAVSGLNDQGRSQAIPSNQAIPRQRVEFSLRPRGTGTPFSGINVPKQTGASFDSGEHASNANEDDSSAMKDAPVDNSAVNTSTTNSAALNASTINAASIYNASLPKPIQPTAEVPDDLEELAERAFAISPRLGAMSELDDDTPMFSDPLDELLGEIEEEEARMQGQTVPEGVDNENRAEQRTLQENEIQDEAGKFEPSQDSSEESKVQVHDEQNGLEDIGGIESAISDPNNTNEQIATADGNEMPTSDPPEEGFQGEDNTNQSGTNTGVSQNPPPISGGPPPRRRRS